MEDYTDSELKERNLEDKENEIIDDVTLFTFTNVLQRSQEWTTILQLKDVLKVSRAHCPIYIYTGPEAMGTWYVHVRHADQVFSQILKDASFFSHVLPPILPLCSLQCTSLVSSSLPTPQYILLLFCPSYFS